MSLILGILWTVFVYELKIHGQTSDTGGILAFAIIFSIFYVFMWIYFFVDHVNITLS